MNPTIREILIEIKGDNDLLDPAVVVEEATNPKHPLHPHFEWDDAKCGREHRLFQARHLITFHMVTEKKQPEVISLSTDRVDGTGYRFISDVLEQPELKDVMLADALRELERVRAKYGYLRKLSGVFRELDKVRAKSAEPKRRKGGAEQRANV